MSAVHAFPSRHSGLQNEPGAPSQAAHLQSLRAHGSNAGAPDVGGPVWYGSAHALPPMQVRLQ